MKPDWRFRWWDVVVLAATAGAVWGVVQYSLHRRGNEAVPEGLTASGPVRIVVRLSGPLPELLARVRPGDPVLDGDSRIIGSVLSCRPAQNGRSGEWDLSARVRGVLPLFRNLNGLPRIPLALRPGVWCLVASRDYELAGPVIRVEPDSKP